MTRFLLLMLMMLSLLMIASASIAQQTVPTLVPPTLVPRQPTPIDDTLPSESAVARIQRENTVRVGVLYNEAPFSELTIRGEVRGYEADVLRQMADLWEVDIDFVQVTRQDALDMLDAGEVDLLAAALVHERELDKRVEFSHTYHIGRQAMLVPADADFASIYNMGAASIGYVVGTPAETALNQLIATTEIPLQPTPYLTLDKAYAALYAGEVRGVVGRRERLLQVAENELEAVKLLGDVIAPEPFAIAMPRQDINLRNLVNRTLQYLMQDRSNINAASTLEQLHQEYFPAAGTLGAALPVWENIGEEAPALGQVGVDMPFPQQYAIPRVREAGVLRVAGLQEVPPDAPQSVQRVAQLNRAIAEQIAQRWGVTLQPVEGDPVALVENGGADLAVGIAPDWELAPRVDFSQPYVLHGDRLLVPENRDIQGFRDLRTSIAATFLDDPDAEDRATAWSESVNVMSLRFFGTTEERLVETLLDDNNATVAFGDSLKLVPNQQESAGALEFTDRWYSREYIALAVPRNDIDFRVAINYTLQAMQEDGTLTTLLRPITPGDAPLLRLDVWAGSRSAQDVLNGS